jgi:hypothetical protein
MLPERSELYGTKYSHARISADSLSTVFTAAWKKVGNYRNKQFTSFKTHAKQEQVVTW